MKIEESWVYFWHIRGIEKKITKKRYVKNADAGHLKGLTNDVTKQTSKTKQNHLYFYHLISISIYVYLY